MNEYPTIITPRNTFRLAEQLETRECVTIDVNVIYTAYRNEATAASADTPSRNITVFGKLIKRLFDCSTMLSNHDRHITYIDLAMRENTTDAISFDDISDVIVRLSRGSAIPTQVDNVGVSMESGVFTNEVPITKSVLFCRDGTWELYVGSVTVNLGVLKVSNLFKYSRQSIAVVLVATRIPLSLYTSENEWRATSRCVSTRTSRAAGRKDAYIVRTRACLRVVPFSTHSDMASMSPVLAYKLQRSANQLREQKPSTLRRWHPLIWLLLSTPSCQERRHRAASPALRSLITTCLSLWIKSPQAYRDLLGTGLIILPSRSILKLYKSDVQQDAGFHPKIFKWMRLEPLRQNLPPAAYHGGILVDEMSIVHRRRSAGGAVRAVRSGGAVRYAAGWFRRPRSRVSATVDVANRHR